MASSTCSWLARWCSGAVAEQRRRKVHARRPLAQALGTRGSVADCVPGSWTTTTTAGSTSCWSERPVRERARRLPPAQRWHGQVRGRVEPDCRRRYGAGVRRSPTRTWTTTATRTSSSATSAASDSFANEGGNTRLSAQIELTGTAYRERQEQRLRHRREARAARRRALSDARRHGPPHALRSRPAPQGRRRCASNGRTACRRRCTSRLRSGRRRERDAQRLVRASSIRGMASDSAS